MPRPYIESESSLSYLIEFLNERENWQNPKRYIIYECFSNSKCELDENTYEVYNLKLEEENGCVWTDDANGYIRNNKVWLQAFLLKQVSYLQFHSIEPYITITLIGDTYDGYIRIYY